MLENENLKSYISVKKKLTKQIEIMFQNSGRYMFQNSDSVCFKTVTGYVSKQWQYMFQISL